jgi:putative DNA primase/helicase
LGAEWSIRRFYEATTDSVQIRPWWKKTPQANIGCPMGKPSGRLLLDLDFRNGGPKDRKTVVEQYGAIPETAEVITPGPGRHIYFLDPGGRVPAHLAKGIDLKRRRMLSRAAHA